MDQQSSKSEKVSPEDELLELAKKELLHDIKCAAMRAEQFGAHSWAKPQKYVPSRRFLQHMLVSASRDNVRKNNRLKGNRISKVTSAERDKYQKHEHSSDKERKSAEKHSRWDSDISTKYKKMNANYRNKEKNSYPLKSKQKRTT